MADFNSQIVKGFGMNLNHYNKAWDAYICNTDQGIKLVKETNIHTGRLLFGHSAKEHLYHQGLKQIDRFCPSVQNTLYYIYGGRKYVMVNWIEGEYCEYEDFSQVKKSVAALGVMHQLSKGMTLQKGSRSYSNLGKIPGVLDKKTRELKRIRNSVHRQSHYSNFDLMFLRNYPYFYQLALESMKLLEGSNYLQMVQRAYQDQVFCHNDYTDHNIMFGPKRDIFITNFDSCTYELPICDLANFIERVISKRNWNTEEALEMVYVYHKVRPILQDELPILISLLMFPMKFWKICNREYNSSRVWRSKKFMEKLDSMAEDQEQHRKFIQEIKKVLLQ